MEPKFKPESVIGVYCFTYPDHEGKDVHTCDHCVELIPEYLTPEAQLALQEAQRYKEMWDGLIKWLAVTDYRNQEYGYAAVTRKMIELESQPVEERCITCGKPKSWTGTCKSLFHQPAKEGER